MMGLLDDISGKIKGFGEVAKAAASDQSCCDEGQEDGDKKSA
jgi:hypothetical protein